MARVLLSLLLLAFSAGASPSNAKDTKCCFCQTAGVIASSKDEKDQICVADGIRHSIRTWRSMRTCAAICKDHQDRDSVAKPPHGFKKTNTDCEAWKKTDAGEQAATESKKTEYCDVLDFVDAVECYEQKDCEDDQECEDGKCQIKIVDAGTFRHARDSLTLYTFGFEDANNGDDDDIDTTSPTERTQQGNARLGKEQITRERGQGSLEPGGDPMPPLPVVAIKPIPSMDIKPSMDMCDEGDTSAEQCYTEPPAKDFELRDEYYTSGTQTQLRDLLELQPESKMTKTKAVQTELMFSLVAVDAFKNFDAKTRLEQLESVQKRWLGADKEPENRYIIFHFTGYTFETVITFKRNLTNEDKDYDIQLDKFFLEAQKEDPLEAMRKIKLLPHAVEGGWKKGIINAAARPCVVANDALLVKNTVFHVTPGTDASPAVCVIHMDLTKSNPLNLLKGYLGSIVLNLGFTLQAEGLPVTGDGDGSPAEGGDLPERLLGAVQLHRVKIAKFKSWGS